MNDKSAFGSEEHFNSMKEDKELYQKQAYKLEERVGELEEKIKLERRLNKDLHKLQEFLQNNPELSKHRYSESISLIAVDAMELLQEEKIKLEERVEILEKMLSSEAIYYPLRAEHKNPTLEGEEREEFYDIYMKIRKMRENK